MKKLILSLLCLSVLSAVCSAGEMSREELMAALRENHHRAAAGHNSYEAPSCTYTPAPRGFRPVYVSHYSRHGSRYQGSRESFERVLPFLDDLSIHQMLTPTGDSLRRELRYMYEAHWDMEGLLTAKGGKEQRDIAWRMYHNSRRLFVQKNAKEIHASATSAIRCLQSMADFSTELKGLSPDVQVKYHTGLAANLHYLAPRVPKEDKSFVRSNYEGIQDSLLNATDAVSSAALRLFADVDALDAFLGGKPLSRMVYEIFEAAQGAGCLDIAVDPLRFFSTEELYDFLEIRNLYFLANYGPYAPTMEMRSKVVIPLMQGIVKEADAALAGNGRCADLRFGHDGGLGPLLILLGIEGFDKGIHAQDALMQWQAWKYIPMCSNVQLIFYRNRKGEVLVKVLRNEEETRIPALEPVKGIYYRWADLRRYLLCRTGDYKELPSYYEEYLDAKAEEIAALGNKEADGFFFCTDSHFPDNRGNAAAIIEYLQNKVGPRKLFFGGDAALNADRIADGLAANTSMLLQAGAYGNLFPLRGNHDFTSSTAKDAVPETMSEIQVCRYLSSFRSPAAISDAEACCPNYYCVDSPEAKIRYLVLDSSDSVNDSRIITGMSDSQVEWVSRQISSLPKGWNIVSFSHIPLAPDHTGGVSLLKVGKMLADASPDVLMNISGHRHSDFEAGIGSMFQVLTAADCFIESGKRSTPYSLSAGLKVKDTVNEQTLDYVSISKDHKVITMKRIGHGYDRVFHLSPIKAAVGQSIDMSGFAASDVKWFAYDAQGSHVPVTANKVSTLQTKNDRLVISESGVAECLSSGAVIVVATAEDGSKDYFMISIN